MTTNMHWLDSGPVKFLNFVACVVTIATSVGGVFAGKEIKGDEWGIPLAATIGGFMACAAAALFFVGLNLLVLRFRRDCPYCGGSGAVKVRDELFVFQPARGMCPKCHGDGKIF